MDEAETPTVPPVVGAETEETDAAGLGFTIEDSAPVIAAAAATAAGQDEDEELLDDVALQDEEINLNKKDLFKKKQMPSWKPAQKRSEERDSSPLQTLS